jgi:hypothetical protein
MPRCLSGLLLLALLFLPACQQAPGQASPGGDGQALPPIQVYFCPNGGCTEAVVKQINAVKSTILVQADSFTSTSSGTFSWNLP